MDFSDFPNTILFHKHGVYFPAHPVTSAISELFTSLTVCLLDVVDTNQEHAQNLTLSNQYFSVKDKEFCEFVNCSTDGLLS